MWFITEPIRGKMNFSTWSCSSWVSVPVQSPTTSLLFAALSQYATELRERTKVRGLVYPGWTRSVYAYVALVARGLNERALAGKPRWTRMNNALQAETKLMKKATIRTIQLLVSCLLALFALCLAAGFI